MPQQAPQKARRLRRVLSLLARLLQLRMSLLQRNILHQHALRQNIKRIRIGTQSTRQQRRRIRVFFIQLCGIYPLDERVQHLFFL